jgi:tRNA-dihydrouridine synthase A
MMEWTDRHTRYFHRLLSRRVVLYTEMVTTGAVTHGDRARLLGFDSAEHPVALQLGGCEPDVLAECARIGAGFGYDEINLNVGCPSDRVQSGRFGACLMAEPALVAACVEAMARAVPIPVTVKTRIGIDQRDSYAELRAFVAALANTGCRTVIVHARKAWLQGLSPKENREVPPLRYDRVYRLKADFPHLEIVINGGVEDLDQAERYLRFVDGVMLGRAAYQNPYVLADVDSRCFGETGATPSRHDVARALVSYVERQMEAGVPLKSMTRHYLGLFNGCPGARAWRRTLSEQARDAGAGADLLLRAASLVAQDEALPPAAFVPRPPSRAGAQDIARERSRAG